MLTRPGATCLRPLRTGDALLGASARDGTLRLPDGVTAFRRRRLCWTWTQVPSGARLRPRDRLLVAASGESTDPRTSYRDPASHGRAIHRPGDALTLLGKGVTVTSRLAVWFSCCALLGIVGQGLYGPERLYWGVKDRQRPTLFREMTKRILENDRQGRIPRRVPTPEQMDRMRDEARGAGMPIPKWLLQ